MIISAENRAHLMPCNHAGSSPPMSLSKFLLQFLRNALVGIPNISHQRHRAQYVFRHTKPLSINKMARMDRVCKTLIRIRQQSAPCRNQRHYGLITFETLLRSSVNFFLPDNPPKDLISHWRILGLALFFDSCEARLSQCCEVLLPDTKMASSR
jgi:hypothetical protein